MIALSALLCIATVAITAYDLVFFSRCRLSSAGSQPLFTARYCFIATLTAAAGPIFFVFAPNDPRTLFAGVVSCMVASLRHGVARAAPPPVPVGESSKPQQRQSGLSVALRVALSFALSGALPAFFFAVAAVMSVRAPKPCDAGLLRIDRAIAGWAFPDGQLALWVDRDPVFGPPTILGSIMVDFLTIWYISYYVWPYLGMAALLLRCIWSERRKGAAAESRAWAALETFMCAWVASFGVTFVLNAFFPAASPRLYIKDQFVNPLDGFGLRKLIEGIIHQDNTFGSFPSGHVGETLAVALALLRIGVTPRLGKFVLFAASIVSLATLWLRYHYLIDVIAAVAVAIFAAWFAGPGPAGTASGAVASSVAAQLEAAKVDEEMPIVVTTLPATLRAKSTSPYAVPFDSDVTTLEQVVIPSSPSVLS